MATASVKQRLLFESDGKSGEKSDVIEVGGDDHSYLRRSEPLPSKVTTGRFCVVDLFCGAGGLSLGLQEAARSLASDIVVGYAIDFDAAAAACYAANFPTAAIEQGDITKVFQPGIKDRLSLKERAIRKSLPKVDVLVGGPPCQGHSDLNNFSRRDDPKNALYLYMVRAAKVFDPTHVLIENVSGVVHDRKGVVQVATDHLNDLGYTVSSGLVDGLHIGVPQSRKRFLLIASKTDSLCVKEIERRYHCKPRQVRWAIEDLVNEPATSLLTTPCSPSPDTAARIDYLFDNKLWELPNEQRPPCHRDKKHSYNSVYGRLYWDRPAQTITSGFYCMCMGRYVHPSRRRTLTAHEAARLQFLPDFFDLTAAENRTSLARIIGNAVPMKFGYVFGRELFKCSKRM